MREQGDIHLTWRDRRELELELWLDDHLRAVAATTPEDLDDPAAMRALATRAAALADAARRLGELRGYDREVEAEVESLRETLR